MSNLILSFKSLFFLLLSYSSVSAGKRASSTTQSPVAVKGSTSLTRKKPEKSPPSQSIKALNKKWWMLCGSFLWLGSAEEEITPMVLGPHTPLLLNMISYFSFSTMSLGASFIAVQTSQHTSDDRPREPTTMSSRQTCCKHLLKSFSTTKTNSITSSL